MARVGGPLLSQSASGTVAKTLTFLRSRGRDVVRGYVVPSNPRMPMQAQARTVIKVSGQAITRIFNQQVGKSAADGALDPYNYLLGVRGDGDTFASAYNRRGFDQGYVTFNADVAAWTALTSDQMTAWETWNSAFTRPFDATTGAPMDDRSFVSGEVAFIFARAMFRTGYLAALPGIAPPDWDNSLAVLTQKERARGRAFQRGLSHADLVAQGLRA